MSRALDEQKFGGIGVAVGITSCLCALAPSVAAAAADKKLIAWGWDTSTPVRVQQAVNSGLAEGIDAFDGVVVFNSPAWKNGQVASVDWEFFSNHRFERADIAQTISTIDHINYSSFTDNFVRFNVSTNPGSNVDWFDNFDNVLHNVGLWAEAAQETGHKWKFDLEDYGEKMFYYPNMANAGTKTFAQYAAQVRLRGKQVMQAIQQEDPDATLLLSLAHSYVYTHPHANLSQVSYGLLPSFVDGLIEGAGPQVTIIDGQEQAYGYLDAEDYLEGARIIREDAQALVSPELRVKYRNMVKVGVGMFANYQLGEYFYPPTGWPTYYMTPQERLESFEKNVYWALRTTDKYAWFYSEGMGWWEEGYEIPTPPGAVEAIRSAQAKIDRMNVDAVILSDSFAGLAGIGVNAAKWVAPSPPGVRLDGGGHITIDSDAQPGAQILALGGPGSVYGFKPNDNVFGRLVALEVDHAIGGFANIGLTTDASANTEIMMRSGPEHGQWYLRVADGPNEAIFLTDVPKNSENGDWLIEWYDDRVIVYYNGDVKVDTSVNAPTSIAGSGLDLPSVNLLPYAAKWGGDWFELDELKWGVVSESGSLVSGDADFDADVDLADLGRLATYYGLSGNAVWPMGNFDGDADVDLSDLGVLASNYGAGAAQAMADFEMIRAAIPEPASATASVLLLLLPLRRRHV